MPKILLITLIGTAAGVFGTGIGGIIGVILGKPSRRFMGMLMGFSGGLMMSIVFFGLIPQSLAMAQMVYSLIGVALGTVLICGVDCMMVADDNKMDTKGAKFKKMGMLLAIGIALHNFPEGLAIGAGFISAEKYGLGLALIFAMHNGPEGMAMTFPLRIYGYTPMKVIAFTAATGIPMGIGAFIGNLLGWIAPQFISVCLGFAAGAMLYITVGEVIPESLEMNKGLASRIGIIIGIIIGIVLTMIL